jgi:hypothetical protein
MMYLSANCSTIIFSCDSIVFGCFRIQPIYSGGKTTRAFKSGNGAKYGILFLENYQSSEEAETE